MNYISFIVYGLFLISFAIGIKIAPRKSFNEDSLSLNAMTSLKGILALFVIMHHLSQQTLFQKTETISFFKDIGFLFVGIFFFTSGYGLYKSFSTKENYLKGFPKKRILPIVITYYLMIAIYAIYYLISGNDFSGADWIRKLSGFTLINSQSWFVYVIVIMYFAFYFVYKNEKLRKHGILILLIVALLQGALFVVNGHFPWWIGEERWWMTPGAFGNVSWWQLPCVLIFEGEWWVNSTVAFSFGVFVAQKENSIIEWSKKNYWVKFAITVVILALVTFAGLWSLSNIGYWAEFGGSIGIWQRGVCYLIQCVQCIATCFFLMMLMRKIYVQNKFYNFLGKRTLEIYLLQEMVLFAFAFLIQVDRKTPIFKPYNTNVILDIGVVVVTVVISSIIFNLICKVVSKKH